jgi:uncharacterized OB-fold protein
MCRRGTLFTYSVVHSGMDAFKDQTPYVVALVKEGQQIRLARVEGYTDRHELVVGMDVDFMAEDQEGHPIYRFSSCPE